MPSNHSNLLVAVAPQRRRTIHERAREEMASACTPLGSSGANRSLLDDVGDDTPDSFVSRCRQRSAEPVCNHGDEFTHMTSDANGSFLMKWIRKNRQLPHSGQSSQLVYDPNTRGLNSLPASREMLSGNNLTER